VIFKTPGLRLPQARSHNVIFLVTGHSRGAAVANLLSVMLNDDPNINKSRVFSYNFASPCVIKRNTKETENGYENIFYINNLDDNLINYIPPDGNWMRYGKDILFPGGSVQGVTGGAHRAEIYQKKINEGLPNGTRPLE